MTEQFEDIVDSDSLWSIFKFVRQRHRIPFLFVNRRWRMIAQRKRKAIEKWRGMSFMMGNYASWVVSTHNFDLLLWHIKMGCRMEDRTLAQEIVKANDERMIDWGLQNGVIDPKWSTMWMSYAFQNENWKLIGLLDKNKVENYRVIFAAERGQTALVQYLLDRVPNHCTEVLNAAISFERYDLAEWIMKERECNSVRAVKLNLNNARWIKEKFKEWKEVITDSMAKFFSNPGYNIEFVNWYFENKLDSIGGNRVISKNAIEMGYIDVLKILEKKYYNNTYILSADPVVNPLLSRNLDLLRWSLSEGFLPNDFWRCERNLGEWGSVEAFDLISNLTRLNQNDLLCYSSFYDNWKLVDHAMSKGFKFSHDVHDRMDQHYIVPRDIESFKMVLKRGFVLTGKVAEKAAATCSWKTFSFIIEKGCPWTWTDCTRESDRTGNVAVTKWISAQRIKPLRRKTIPRTIEFDYDVSDLYE